MTPEQLREEASKRDQQAQDSFDRCDTDGFLSQWASGLTARKLRLQADIEENGGNWSFPALFDLEDNQVAAKLIDGRYGTCWALLDDTGNFTGTFVSAFPARESTMTKKGYREGSVELPAYAKIVGSGTGLSGSAWVDALPAIWLLTDEQKRLNGFESNR